MVAGRLGVPDEGVEHLDEALRVVAVREVTTVGDHLHHGPGGRPYDDPNAMGVALYGDRLFVATVDCFLVALDARTGKEIWAQQVEDYQKGTT